MKKPEYKYLSAVKFFVISKMLGYSGQGIRPEFSGHERLFTELNDKIGEVIEKLGGVKYKKNHKYMKRKPTKNGI